MTVYAHALGLATPTLLSAANEAAGASSGSIPWWLYAGVASVVVAAGVGLLVVAIRRGRPQELPCPKCGKIMMSDWAQCMFCKAPRSAKKAALQFVSGPMSGTVVELEAEVTTIGSAAGSTVTLGDTGVSRRHAGIRRLDTGAGYEVADLGSKNGVYVNGEKVARKKLDLGDVIRIGASEMIFKN